MEHKNIHMIGIGGIGISALAQLYVHTGHRVSGVNDNQSPQTLDRLRALGVAITVGANPEDIPNEVDFFVYSDAWLTRAPEFMEQVRACGKPMYSYFEALGEATKEGTSIVVSGTHGKTTTTAMLAKILIDAGKEPTVIAGSILADHGSNFVPGRPDLFVIEGCEYRRHFLQLHPHVLVINNIELDHTDYYRDLEDMQDAFRSAISLLPVPGTVVTNTASEAIKSVLQDVPNPIIAYQEVSVPKLLAPGAFNRMNAQAAKAGALAYDPSLDPAGIDTALATFRGTWRRFEYRGTTARGAMVYDDYAHHPTAVRGTLEMVRQEFPEKRLVVVFHPHLFSRTHDFMDAFAMALARADEVLLAPIYPAREEPIPGVTSEVLAEKVRAFGVSARAGESLESIKQTIEDPQSCIDTSQTIILTMGAGDVYLIADALVSPVSGGGLV
jgi:UDP-N-acetylmuramate--alanine ligase